MVLLLISISLILVLPNRTDALELKDDPNNSFLGSNFTYIGQVEHGYYTDYTVRTYEYSIGNIYDDAAYLAQIEYESDFYSYTIKVYDSLDNQLGNTMVFNNTDDETGFLTEYINVPVEADYIQFDFTVEYDITNGSALASYFSNFFSNSWLINFHVFELSYNNYDGVDVDALATIYYNNGYSDSEDYYDPIIVGLNDTIDSKDTIISGLNDTIDSKDLIIADKDTIITNKNTTINNLENEITSLESDIEGKDTQIANLQSQINDLQADGPRDSEVITNFFGSTLGAVGSFFTFLLVEIDVFGVNLAMVLTLVIGLGVTVYLLKLFL